MTENPFVSLVVDALNLMHPRFAAAHGRAYTPAEADEPPAARKVKERSFLLEFYHEFRRLWDQAAPIRRGLGHVVIQGDPDVSGRQPDLLFWKLGEHGEPDRRLAALSLVFCSNPAAAAADLKLLTRFRTDLGYPLAICVWVGMENELSAAPTADGVVGLPFEVVRWAILSMP